MNNLMAKMLRNYQSTMKINTPNKNCVDKCENAKKALLFIANNTQDDLDITQIIITCFKCQESYWKIEKKKETEK